MSLRRYTAAFAALALLAATVAPAHSAKLILGGYDTLTFRHNSVSGASAGQQAFNYGNYERQRALENNAGLIVTLYPLTSDRLIFNAHINSNRFSADRSRYSLEYKGNGLNFLMGDINAALGGNEFVPFQKSLRGIRVDGRLGQLTLNTLLSQERAQVATDHFYGTNSPGPYSLRYSPIIDGSAKVRVDGQEKVFGTDYTLDLNTGMLWFQPSMIIPSTSLIEVSYEYAGYGSSPGILAGVRGEIPIGKLGRVGTTYITQMSRVGDDNPSADIRTDLFIGDNTPMVLWLRNRPVERIVKITVDSIPQVEGLDYEVQSLEAGVVRFRKVVPAPPGPITDAAPNVVVEYEVVSTTAPGANLGGDRSILGLDTLFNFGEKATLGIQFARSGGTEAQSGNALSIRGNTTLGRLTMGINFRDIGKQFTAIESVGFQQRERAFDGSVEYGVSDHMRLTARIGSSLRPMGSSPYGGYYYPGGYPDSQGGSDTEEEIPEDATIHALQSTFGVNVSYPNLPQLDLTHQQYRTTGPRLASTSGLTNMRLHYTLGSALNLSANFMRNANADSGSAGTRATSLTQSYSASYTPGSRFSLQADYSVNNLRSQGRATTETDAEAKLVSTTNRATSANMTMTYSPVSIATLTASVRLSDSGTGGYGGYGGAYTGFGNSYYSSAYSSGSYLNSGNYSFGDQYTGSYYSPYANNSGSLYGSSYTTGTGSYPSGFDALSGLRSRQDGDSTNPDDTSTRIRSINRSVGLQVSPMERLSFTLNFGHDRQEGQFTASNSVSTNAMFGFNYSPWDAVSFNGTLTRQRYNFLGAGGNSNSNIFFTGAQIGPFLDAGGVLGRLGLNLNYQAMTTNTGMPALSGGLDSTGIDATSPSSFQTRLNTILARLEYPIAQNRKLFTVMEHSRTRGGGSYGIDSSPENSFKRSLGFGVEFAVIPNRLSWTVDMRNIHYRDQNNPQRNYAGNLITGEARANF